MKKKNKFLIGVFVLLAAVLLVPSMSVSKDAQSDTIILSKSNLLLLNSQVEGESTGMIIAKAKELDNALNSKRIFANKKPLYLFLNTPGGDIQSGLELIEALKGIGRPVDTITLFAASMGFQIAQNLDERLILKNGVLMSHHAAGEFQGSFGGVHPSQVDGRYQLWLDRVRELDEQTVKRTNGRQTYESYTKQYDKEMWLTGTKSVEQGYADRIVSVRCDSSLNGTTPKTANFLGFLVAFDLDLCPINTSPMNVHISSLSDGKMLENVELMNDIKSKFMSQYENKEKQVSLMYR